MKRFITSIFLLFLPISAQRLAAQLLPPHPAWYLPVGDGCNLFVQEFGTGPETVVVLHGGWGAEHSYLLKAFENLPAKYRLVFYDQRGSLLSPCPAEKISVEAHVADLEKLRIALGLPRVNIVAHSMGTFLAMKYLQEHPENVQGLVLLGAIPPVSGATSDDVLKLSAEREAGLHNLLTRPEVTEELQAQGLDKPASAMTPQQSSDAWRIHFASANLYHVDRWRQMEGGKAFFNQSAGQAAGKTMGQWNFTSALAARSCPTYVVDGDHDFVIDDEGKMFRAATKNIPGVTVILLKDAGHNAWIDAPKEFADTLASSLQKSIQCAKP